MERSKFIDRGGHLYSLDILKFLFAFCVFYYHLFNGKIFEKGYLCVDYFFIVSGYFLALSYSKKTECNEISWSLQMVKKKIFALAFPYYLAWTMIFIANHLHSDIFHISSDLINSVFELLFLRMAGFGIYMCNGVTWYISALFIAMLICLPIYCKWKNVYIKYLGPIASIFIYVILNQFEKGNQINYWVQQYTNGTPYLGLLRAIAGISLGLISYDLVNELIKKQINNIKSITLVSIILWALIFTYIVTPTGFYSDYVMVLIGYIAIVTTIFCEKKLMHNDNKKVDSLIKWLGRMSLCIYLFQNVIFIVKNYIQTHWIDNKFVVVMIASILILVISMLITRINDAVKIECSARGRQDLEN